MTKQEVTARYQIPMAILEEYEQWHLCDAVKQVMAVWQYDDRDIERLSMIMTLHDIGFSKEEIEHYMRLYLSSDNTEQQRLHMLEQKRIASLDEIHFKEAQLSRLDYLRHQLKKSQRQKE